VADPRLRIIVSGEKTGDAKTITVDRQHEDFAGETFIAKEWSLVDDMLNVSDTASVTIPNEDGRNAGKFRLGQRVKIDESDPAVANGEWVRQFTGRIVSIESHSDIAGGSNILLTMMDLGWHLTSCHAQPHKNLKRVPFSRLVSVGGLLIEKSWGFAETEFSNADNRVLKHGLRQGRRGVELNFQPQIGAVLPYIQVEPGQSPLDILQSYAQREGLMVNVGAKGQLVLFQPDYKQPVSYAIHYHAASDDRRRLNNVQGRPSLRESVDGLYSEVQCWSTLTSAQAAALMQKTDDPNAVFRKGAYRPDFNPLPFFRRHVFMDGEAISPLMRKNRAIWRGQMDRFNAWEYTVDMIGHSQKLPGAESAAFYTSDSMTAVHDTVNGVGPAAYYVQAVRRSVTLSGGVMSRLTIRKPDLLRPDLVKEPAGIGAGARRGFEKKTVKQAEASFTTVLTPGGEVKLSQ